MINLNPNASASLGRWTGPSEGAFDDLDVAVLVADADGAIVAANAAARDALGQDEDLVGRQVDDVVAAADHPAPGDPTAMTERLSRIEQTMRAALDEVAKVRQQSADLAEVAPALDPARLDRLSERERLIVRRLLAGYRVPTIAAELYLSQSTIRNHLSAAFRKLGVRSQAELLELARAESVVADDPCRVGGAKEPPARLRLAPTGTAAGQ